MRSLRSRTTWQLGAALWLAAAPGRATTPPEVREQLVALADAAVQESRLADARDAWRALWKLERSQVAACNIGALSYRIGDLTTAVRWLSYCKEIMRPPTTPEERAIHASRLVDLARARERVGEIRVIAPPGTSVSVDGEPIALDDELAETSDTRAIPVTPGRHIVRGELNGAIAEAEVNVPRGETREAKLTFVTPPPRTPLPAARPRIAGAIEPEPPGPDRGVVLGGLAAAGVFAAIGYGLFTYADDERSEGADLADRAGPNRCFHDDKPECKAAERHGRAMATARSYATASYIAGGVLLAGTVGYLLYPHKKTEIVVSAEGIAVRVVW